MKKKWLSLIVIFLFVQVVFLLIDGTRFEPRLNDSGNIVSRFAEWITESKLVTEWFTIYSYPYFNLVTLVFITALVINLMIDLMNLQKNRSE